MSDLSDMNNDVEPGEEEPHLLVFKVRLPFGLPLRADRVHVFNLNEAYAEPADEQVYGRPMVRLRLAHAELPPEKATPAFRPGFLEGLQALDGVSSESGFSEPPAHDKEVQTWAELATQSAPLVGEDESYLDTECFERCLEQLNHLIRGFQLVVNDPLVRPVNKESLDPMLLIDRENESGERLGGSIFLLHGNFNGGHGFNLVSEQEENRIYAGMELIAFDQPFTRHREWLERAKDARFRRGDYEEALICLQVSVECLLSGLLRGAAVDEGLRSREVSERVERCTSPFATLVGTHMPALLGGHWATDDLGVIGVYWRDLYLVRNSMSHAGRRTTFSQISAAFDAFDGLVDFIVARLLRSPTRFPRTIFALLGEPGLRKRNNWTRRMREFAAQLAHEPYPYWAPWDTVGREDPMADSADRPAPT